MDMASQNRGKRADARKATARAAHRTRRISRGPLADSSALAGRIGDCTCGECAKCLQRHEARVRYGLGRRKAIQPETAFELWSRERQKVWLAPQQ